MKKILAFFITAAMCLTMTAAAFAQEAAAVDPAEYGIPDEYTKVKVFDGTYGFGDAQIAMAFNDAEDKFYITFECFDEEQVLEGSVVGGMCTVTYDLTGFVSGDCQLIYDDGVMSENPWQPLVSGGAQVEEETEEVQETEYDFEGFTQIVTEGTWGEPTVFNLLPDGYNYYETENKGTDVVIHYTTDVYGETYEKFCRVYLPYGYDPDDTETKYNVVYFQHGNSGSPNELFDHDMKSLHALNLLNNIFDPDHQVIDPVIIVCPTFYLEYDETAYVTPGDNPAGDGRYEGIEDKYYLEILQDLIPAVESQFNVYCEDFTPEGIRATRDHRAWAGYSRGSADTWKLFTQDFEYFGYWMPMSCRTMAPGSRDEMSDEEIYEYLKAPVEAYPDLDFFILATNGGPNDGKGMQEELEYLAGQTETFSFGNDPEVNNLYFIRSEFNHNDLYFPYSLANTGDIFFK